MDLQAMMMRLDEYWAAHGCLVWQPHNVQVGAGTMNPATALRVLGPEPWNVAYVEPSVRPDDGRYGENPNRWGQYFQYQVILKPDPGNPLELYLGSLRALGVDTAAHDVRFVEDNWESPALGAWGLGWEVWLDGQEISQYTYFQQAGGQETNPVSVEITYGLERIVMVMQGVRGFSDIRFMGQVTYGDLLLRGEVEHCIYNFQVADVNNLHQMYDLCEAEARNALARGLVMPAHDYVLKCSHIFNVLDARGAVGVTERARYFVRMRDQARQVSSLFIEQRREAGHPLAARMAVPGIDEGPLPAPVEPQPAASHDLLLEIGCEELPVADLEAAVQQLRANLPRMLSEARLAHASVEVCGTPRRLVARVSGLATRQDDVERVFRGPAASIAYDAQSVPTRAAQGFARSRGVDVGDLQVRSLDGKDYVVAVVAEKGRGACAVLADVLPGVVRSLTFARAMRWNASQAAFSRPLRWYVALLDDQVVPFEYAGVRSGRVSRGTRPQDSRALAVATAGEYVGVIEGAGVVLAREERETRILAQAGPLAAEVGGELPDDAALLREVADLVEDPLALRGEFAQEYLRLPDVVLLAVMRKHQRYLPVVREGKLLPWFIAIANGRGLDVDAVRDGNEQVLRARYADAAYFYDADVRKPLSAYTERLDTLTFQERLGSVGDKVRRIERLAPQLAELLGLDAGQTDTAARAASLCKSDLATQLVVELTSLQGKMGRHYALLSGESPEVAQAIEEHYLPSFVGDRLPVSPAGVVVGLADRLDTLVGLFAVGIRPTGAADPWGLRRAALGLVQLLLGKEMSLALPEAISLAAELLPVPAEEATLREVLDFCTQRYRNWLLEGGYRYDAVDAVLNERGYDPYLAYRTLQALLPWLAHEDWGRLLDTYARCVRITRDQPGGSAVQRELLREPAETELYLAYVAASPTVAAAPGVDTLLGALTALQPAIRRFFDQVLVMDQDPAVRRNRLALLQAIGGLAHGILDLSALEGF